ncbi:hydroxysqualene dehydroxylase HpnE [Actinocrinis puniceicyclus]|uniref:Hydroxysqualene dehydroxylase HpnE n=1 Tax=Actinocrinis puniceicyclus TaxID=977794 RepID=A0A8J8BCC9_9ACTN|nr:hydroxysqualene dehydroxylase HpnE [Actinocrinis puniceicyclus]MBS2962991.1 hydroxysqualene dehydroxylase HpnE [Actinocrinis puniceicyclus]
MSPGLRERRAVVVGGGLAGITAALVLAERGWAVTVVEARPRLGGRATSYRRGGLTVDNGQHVFLRCCTAYRGLLDRLGAGPDSGLTHLQDRLDIPLKSASDASTARLRRTRLPAPLHLAFALGGYGLLPLRDRVRLGGPAFALRRTDPGSERADARGFGQFLREHGQSQAAIDRLWSVISTATLNIAPDDASLALAAKVFRTGLLETNDGADLGYATVPLGRIHDESAGKALDAAGVRVLRATKAEPLTGEREQRAVTVVDRSGLRSDLAADAIVLAVPHDVAATLLPQPHHPTAFGKLGHSPILNIHLRYDRPVLDGPFLAAVDSPAQWIFDRTAASGLDGPPGRYLAVTVSAADEFADTPTRELAALFEAELARLLPQAADAGLEEVFVTRERHATFRQERGSASLRPGPATGMSGVYLAGAWTATGWPDTMESAVRSGINAARLVVDQTTGEG